MHPFIARIHPALRTALLAWLLSRGALWIACAQTSRELATGAPLPGIMASSVEWFAALFPFGLAQALVTLTPWILVELLMLTAGVSVYRFARKTELPQVAERACWLWFFNPILAMTALDWGTQAAAALGALAVAGLVTYRPGRATLAAFLAVGCRLELILLWPALAIAGRRYYRPGKDNPSMPWLAALTVPLSFAFWIGITWHLAGSSKTSLRAVHGEALWRDWSNLIPDFPTEFLLLLSCGGLLLLAMAHIKRFPLWYLVCAVPLLIWPFVQVPVYFAAITLAWALPSFVHLAIATDDRSLERPLFAGLILAYILATPAIAFSF